METSNIPTDSALDERYRRQVALPQLGVSGQKRLLQSSVLVVGCGALGGHIAQVMVRAGVKRIGIIDYDTPAIHNLHRQVLFDEDDVAGGLPKAQIAANRLTKANRHVQIEPLIVTLEDNNAASLIRDYDIVIDGTDNFQTRYAINRACIRFGIPWVYGGVMETRGMMMPILPYRGPCLRCILPRAPEPNETQHCARDGILSTLAMIVAGFACTEAIKILTGAQANTQLLSIEAWPTRLMQVSLPRRPECEDCGKHGH